MTGQAITDLLQDSGITFLAVAVILQSIALRKLHRRDQDRWG